MKRLLLASVIFFSIIAAPSRSSAQVLFGGLDVFEFPCTCSPFMYTTFTPLFLGPLPIVGTLAVPDTPTLFPFYELFPSAWALGTYTPGVQACWMYAVAGCFPLPVIGVMDPFTGTSL
jgi:hypothetical protein